MTSRPYHDQHDKTLCCLSVQLHQLLLPRLHLHQVHAPQQWQSMASVVARATACLPPTVLTHNGKSRCQDFGKMVVLKLCLTLDVHSGLICKACCRHLCGEFDVRTYWPPICRTNNCCASGTTCTRSSEWWVRHMVHIPTCDSMIQLRLVLLHKMMQLTLQTLMFQLKS